MEIGDQALANLEEGYQIFEMNVTGTLGLPTEIRERLAVCEQRGG